MTGEETAVIHYLARGVAKPTFVPPRPYEGGLGGRPTLVQNPETLCQLALIARFGSDWFRELGSDADPGSALVTISGAVRDPGVYELAFGTPMTDLLTAAGGASEPLAGAACRRLLRNLGRRHRARWRCGSHARIYGRWVARLAPGC